MSSSSSKPKPAWSWQRLKERSTAAKLLAASLLLLLLATIAIPSYLSGRWSWAEPVPIANIQQIRSLRTTALALPNWQILPQAQLLNGAALSLAASASPPELSLRPSAPDRAIANIADLRVVPIGGERWSYQELAHLEDGQPPIGVFLLPQMDARKMPEVEWVNLRGAEGWQQEGLRSLQFAVPAGDNPSGTLRERPVSVKARFFRAAAERTFAVVQWYAWPTGGSRSPIAWFWHDQGAQLLRQRQPWVAVCLKIPMRAQDELDALQPLAESLARDVQAALLADIFTS